MKTFIKFVVFFWAFGVGWKLLFLAAGVSH